ncbi:methylcobamide--CoM methyltransferase [Synergistales bacterium]|nr:methylcobamide--CoM methyltransferase [Synergistales bacterium]
MTDMYEFSPRERLQRTFEKKIVDRPPVICPGGMMNAAVTDVMKKRGRILPDAHHTGALMRELALDVHAETGFENIGIPFCMTIEAEALGSDVDYGTLECEPKIVKEPFPSVKETEFRASGAIQKNARAQAVIGVIDSLSKSHPDVPVIGSITGPLSAAASIVDPMTFLKELRRERDGAHRLLDYVTGQLADYARLMADNGAAAISIADPTATGEILGPKMFAEYAVVYLNALTDAIHETGVPVIVHICGNVKMVQAQLAELRSEALSVDALVNLGRLKKEIGVPTTMGNLSTYLLEFADPEKVYENTQVLLKQEIDILAPACGLSTSTPLKNITAFTEAVRER